MNRNVFVPSDSTSTCGRTGLTMKRPVLKFILDKVLPVHSCRLADTITSNSRFSLLKMNPQYAEIGQNFIAQFYQQFDITSTPEERAQRLLGFYHSQSCFTFEDSSSQGQEGILLKIKDLKFQQIAHELTKFDCQPMADGGILIVAIGRLKTDEDQPHSFTHTFILKPEGGSFYIMHEVFRLILHNN